LNAEINKLAFRHFQFPHLRLNQLALSFCVSYRLSNCIVSHRIETSNYKFTAPHNTTVMRVNTGSTVESEIVTGNRCINENDSLLKNIWSFALR